MDYQTDLRFGIHLQQLRNSRGLSQTALAAKLQVEGHDMSRSALAKIESGMRHVYLDYLIAFQRALNISYDELMDF